MEALSSTTMQVTWRNDPGSLCLQRRGVATGKLCHAEKTDNCYMDDAACETIPPDIVSYIIDQLKPATAYCVYLMLEYQTSTATDRVVGLPVTNTTFEDKPSCKPRNLTTWRRDDNQQPEVKWRPPPAECRNGVISKYRINVGINGKEKLSVEQKSTSYTLEQYNPVERYDILVSACTSVGCGPEASISVNGKASCSPRLVHVRLHLIYIPV